MSGVVVTVPEGCRDFVVPLTDPRAGTLTELGVGLAGISSLVGGFDWPAPDPLTHLVLATIEGHGHLRVADDTWELGPGTVAVAPAGVPRRHWTDDSWRLVSIRIAQLPKWKSFGKTGAFVLPNIDVHRFASPINGMLAEVPPLAREAAALTSGLGPMDDLFTRFADVMNWDTTRRNRAIVSDPFSLYATILRLQLETLRSEGRKVSTDADDRLAALWHAVRQDPGADWSIESMARHLNVSRATLHRMVSGEQGGTPGMAVTRIRMNHAANLLAHSDLPVKAIAAQTGHGSAFSFSAAFRRTFGCAPTLFRKRSTPP